MEISGGHGANGPHLQFAPICSDLGCQLTPIFYSFFITMIRFGPQLYSWATIFYSFFITMIRFGPQLYSLAPNISEFGANWPPTFMPLFPTLLRTPVYLAPLCVVFVTKLKYRINIYSKFRLYHRYSMDQVGGRKSNQCDFPDFLLTL